MDNFYQLFLPIIFENYEIEIILQMIGFIVQIIISKYSAMDQPRFPIYDTICKLTKQFSQNYKDNIKNFLVFLKECREQLEVLKKVFQKPLEKEPNIQVKLSRCYFL